MGDAKFRVEISIYQKVINLRIRRILPFCFFLQHRMTIYEYEFLSFNNSKTFLESGISLNNSFLISLKVTCLNSGLIPTKDQELIGGQKIVIYHLLLILKQALCTRLGECLVHHNCLSFPNRGFIG